MDNVSHCRRNDPPGTNYLRFIAAPNRQTQGYELRRAGRPLISSEVDRSSQLPWSVRAGDGANMPGYQRFERLAPGSDRPIAKDERLFSLPAKFARAACTAMTDIRFVGEYYRSAIEAANTEYGRGGVKLEAPVEVGQHRVFVRSDHGHDDIFPRLYAHTMDIYLRSISQSERNSRVWSAESALFERYLEEYFLPLLPGRVTGLNFYYDGVIPNDNRLAYDGGTLPPLPDRKAVVAYLERQVDPWKELARQLEKNWAMINGLLLGGEGK